MGVLNPETYSRKRKISSITGISNFNCHTQQYSNSLIINLLKERKIRIIPVIPVLPINFKAHLSSLLYIYYIYN